MSIASGAINVPGSIKLARSPAPLVKVNELLHIRFERPDLARAERYLRDFGLTAAAQDDNNLYMRGTGTLPYIYHVVRGPKARFFGLAFGAPSEEELNKLSKAMTRPIETSTAPGGGSFVRLRDPDGVAVDIYHGFTPSSTYPLRPAIPHNAPNNIVRVNSTQRPVLEPPQVTKLGHLVLEAADFDASARWYMDTLGFIPSDIMCLPDGTPVGCFMRLDRGDAPSDHHTLFVALGLEPGVDHAAFEVVDIDAVEMGQQVMYANKYRHAWGVGRHLLGSQIFDYWRDPWGQKHEHYADGDLFDASQPPGYHVLDRAGLYQWGPDLPDDFIDARMTPRRLMIILKAALTNRARVRNLLALKKTLAAPGRAWQH